MNKSTYCIEYFYAKPGCREKLLDALLKLVQPSKAEAGCLQYDLIQDNNNPDLIILIVRFEKQMQMEKHENQKYIKDFAENEMKQYCEKFIWNDGREVN